MKLQVILLTLLLGTAVTAQALDQEVQVDLLMNKIALALKEERLVDALPAFAEVESIETALQKPLTEKFYYFYIDTLDKTGDKVKAYSRAEIYMNQYGKKGKHYAEVLAIMSRLQSFVEGERKNEATLSALAQNMVSIPGQNYEMGKYEVTQAEWRAVMGNNPSKFGSCGDNCPVEQVSWDDIQVFLQKLNAKAGKQYRLPTDAEWEYACYGGSKTEYCGGNEIVSVAWYGNNGQPGGNSNQATHPAGQKQANGYGLYDMSGNVWEWMENCYDDNCSYSQRALRGGSWLNPPASLRVSNRNHAASAYRGFSFGFRLARTLP